MNDDNSGYKPWNPKPECADAEHENRKNKIIIPAISL